MKARVSRTPKPEKPQPANHQLISIWLYSGAYIATGAGKSASCTRSSREAAAACAMKIWRGWHYQIRMGELIQGSPGGWTVAVWLDASGPPRFESPRACRRRLMTTQDTHHPDQ